MYPTFRQGSVCLAAEIKTTTHDTKKVSGFHLTKQKKQKPEFDRNTKRRHYYPVLQFLNIANKNINHQLIDKVIKHKNILVKASQVW